ncbi:hypothetical protein ACWEKT_00460 [Nocardia takedensis]
MHGPVEPATKDRVPARGLSPRSASRPGGWCRRWPAYELVEIVHWAAARTWIIVVDGLLVTVGNAAVRTARTSRAFAAATAGQQPRS